MTTVYLVCKLEDGTVDRGDFPESIILATTDEEKANQLLVQQYAQYIDDSSVESKTFKELEEDEQYADSLDEFGEYVFIVEQELQ